MFKKSIYVNVSKLKKSNYSFGIGKYFEERTIYDHSNVFSGNERRIVHLGIDLWIEKGTEVLVPITGKIHSFKNNIGIGDYGPTIILEHILEGIKFYTLYGHLSLESLNNLKIGQKFEKGSTLAKIGNFPTNGNWPAHLHFQIIKDIQHYKGDYPGVSNKIDLEFYKRLIMICLIHVIFGLHLLYH